MDLRKSKLIAFIILAIFIAIAACNPTPLPTSTVPAPNCNSGDQIPYVYHDYRLTKVTDCSHVIGLVDAIRQEADGDIHLALQCANDACKALLTPGNATKQHGDLVVEFICVYPPTQADAVQPCSNDPDPFTPAQMPRVGQCVWIDGRGVNDGIHGWGEIHPVGAFGQATSECAGTSAKMFALEAEQGGGE